MKTFKITSLLLIFSLIATSCYDFFETSIELDIEKHESKLAVTSLISNDEKDKKILVSYSIGGLEEATDTQLINNAFVSLFDGTTTYELSISENQGVYKLENSIIELTENTEYTLTVEAPNYKTVTSKQIFPKPVEIIHASLTNNNLKVRFQDNPEKRNYYILELERYRDNKWTQEYLYSENANTYWSATSIGVIFNDDIFNGNEYELNIQYENYYETSQDAILFRAKLYNITEDLYRYDRTLSISYDAEYSPFVEPVILHRNIENGYGIFGMMNVSEFEFTVD